jgi:hypothetical protein
MNQIFASCNAEDADQKGGEGKRKEKKRKRKRQMGWMTGRVAL